MAMHSASPFNRKAMLAAVNPPFSHIEISYTSLSRDFSHLLVIHYGTL